MDANEFIALLRELLSPTVHASKTVYATFDEGLAPGPGRGSVDVRFFNLPEFRVRERRGGGAENENNKMLFTVYGFDSEALSPVEKVQIEQLVNGVYGPGFPSRENRSPTLRKKTAHPERIAGYLADYINKIAEEFPPKFTHD